MITWGTLTRRAHRLIALLAVLPIALICWLLSQPNALFWLGIALVVAIWSSVMFLAGAVLTTFDRDDSDDDADEWFAQLRAVPDA